MSYINHEDFFISWYIVDRCFVPVCSFDIGTVRQHVHSALLGPIRCASADTNFAKHDYMCTVSAYKTVL